MSIKSLRMVVIVAVLVFLFSFTAKTVSAAACTWDGTTGNWSDTTKWNCGHAPAAADSATIGGGTVTLDSAGVTVGDLTMTGGTLTGDQDLTVSGTFAWSGGTLTTVSAAHTINVQTAINVTGSAGLFLSGSRTLTNTGALTWNSTGYIYMTGTPTFNNPTGATFTVQSSGTYIFYGGVGTINNGGTLTKSSTGDSQIYAGTFNNTGTLSATGAGVLTLSTGASPSSTHTGSFQVSTGATLRFAGANVFNSGASITGAGTVDFNSGTLTFNSGSVYNVTGTTSESGATTHFLTGSTITSLGATLSSTSGSLDLSSGKVSAIGVNTFTLSGGSLLGTDSITTPTLTWTGGTMGGFGTTTVTSALSFSGSGSGTLQDSRTLVNSGTITWNSTGYIYMLNTPTFTNQAAGVFNIQSAGTYVIYGGAGTFNNAGTINKSGSGDTTIYVGAFANSGTVNLANSGVLIFNTAASPTSAQSGAFTISQFATLRFASGGFDFNTGTNITGAGKIDFNGATNNFNTSATINLTGGTLQTGGTTHFNPGSTITSLGTTLTVSGGTLDLSSGKASAIGLTTLTQTGGILTGTDSLTTTTFNWSGGTQGGFGTTTASTNFAVTGASSSTLQDNRVINNAGTLTWNSTGYIYMTGSPVFNNQIGANFNIQTGSTYTLYGGVGTFNNAGTFTKSGTGDTTIYVGNFNNSGTVAISGAGVVTISSATSPSSTQTGVFQTAVNATLRFGQGGEDFNSGTTFTGAGTVDFAGGTLDFNTNAILNMTGATSVSGATVHFNTGSKITSLGATLTISGGILDLSSGAASAISVPAFNQSSGTLNGSDSITTPALNWSGGVMGGFGTTTATTTFTFSGTNSRTLQDSRILVNAGTLTWNSTGYIYLAGTPVFNNQAGATINVVNNGIYMFYGSAGTLTNAGTMNLGTGYINVAHFIQAATGVTKTTFLGTTVASMYLQFNTTDVNLDGTINISDGGTYTPAYKDTFTLINYSTRTGTFKTIVLPTLTDSLLWGSYWTNFNWTLKINYGVFIPAVMRP